MTSDFLIADPNLLHREGYGVLQRSFVTYWVLIGLSIFKTLRKQFFYGTDSTRRYGKVERSCTFKRRSIIANPLQDGWRHKFLHLFHRQLCVRVCCMLCRASLFQFLAQGVVGHQ
jgi:hypothetical protein